MTDAFTLLTQGDFLGSFLAVFTNAGIPADFLALTFILLGCTFIYIRTREIGVVSVTLLMTSSVIISFVTPQTQLYFASMIVFGLAGLIYWFFRGR